MTLPLQLYWASYEDHTYLPAKKWLYFGLFISNIGAPHRPHSALFARTTTGAGKPHSSAMMRGIQWVHVTDEEAYEVDWRLYGIDKDSLKEDVQWSWEGHVAASMRSRIIIESLLTWANRWGDRFECILNQGVFNQGWLF